MTPKQELIANARRFRNPKHTVRGQTGNIKELAAIFGTPYSTAFNRFNALGWDLERALTTPALHAGWKGKRLPLSKDYPGRIFNVEGVLVKMCALCLQNKRLEDFWLRSENSDGLATRCAACMKA